MHFMGDSQLERFLRITIDQGFPGREKTHLCHRVIGAFLLRIL